MRSISIALLLAASTFSSDYLLPPIFSEIPSEKENGTLSAYCEFTDDSKNEISCKFVQLSFTLPEIDTTKEFHDLDSGLSIAKPSEIRKQFKSMCSSFVAKKDIFKKGPYKDSLMKELSKGCLETNPRIGFRKIIREMTIAGSKTCKVRSNDFVLSFKRMGRYKWVSDSSPKGICNISTVSALESKDGILWRYNQIRMGVGNSDAELCSSFDVGKQIVYAWNEDGTFDLGNCQVLEFGL